MAAFGCCRCPTVLYVRSSMTDKLIAIAIESGPRSELGSDLDLDLELALESISSSSSKGNAD